MQHIQLLIRNECPVRSVANAARATVLLTLEAFTFFASENTLDIDQLGIAADSA
jgi:hypothetical protein